MTLVVIMIHYGTRENTATSLQALQHKLKDSRLILINNTSQPLAELAHIVRDTIIVENRENIGFAKAVNQGLKIALKFSECKYILFLNNDLTITQGKIQDLIATFIKKPNCGIVSPILYHSQGLFDWGGRLNKWTGLVNHLNFREKPKTILTSEHTSGAAMLIKRQLVENIGLLDERFFMYYEDVDYCLRAREAGYSIHLNPQVTAAHLLSAGSGASTRIVMNWRSHLLMVNKYLGSKIFPTAYLMDILFYPLIYIKTLIFG